MTDISQSTVADEELLVPDTNNVIVFENSVEAQLIEQIQKNLLVPILVNSLIAIIVVFVMRAEISARYLALWLCSVIGLNFGRYYLFKDQLTETDTIEKKVRWIQRFNVSTAVMGILWGASGILFFADQAIHLQVFLAFVLGGLTAGTVFTYSPWPTTYYCFVVPVALPLAFRFFYEFTELSFFMGFLVLVFAVSASLLMLSFHKSLKTTIRLQVDRSKLVVDLEEANEAKSRFLSSMSHELRTPLNAILGFSQLMENNPEEPLTKAQQNGVNHILNGGYHLLDLINQVLDLEKINRGQIALMIEPLELSVVLNECIDIVEPMAYDKDVSVTANIGDVKMVNSDRTRLKQILLNLISNGIKYNRIGGSVTVDCEESSYNTIQITVSDTGDGIAEEKQNELFVPFNRLGRENSGIEGTGVGLAITKRLLESMGSEISFRSSEGEGSTFWFDLPIISN